MRDIKFIDYRGHYTGCNPVSVGRAAEHRIKDLEKAMRDIGDLLTDAIGVRDNKNIKAVCRILEDSMFDSFPK